ncbi:MAG: SDR family oxidoreductase [Actinomyces sp.]|jgi:alpha-L-rhamnosidase|nr:SDR family NAD(P)-dependent oxidoreductase [Actinomyces sp.]MCI1641886.1 SDR family oxidoreductase [Actinomyces sp.]MCI1661899.1 SDR family oxidoreductase [Actinomyces sp.]MCI1691269.1 SDR family oxidoreductase [Actinomyces sp.]MCI1787702.1 SDR family oxidoreductase [Actinomyces sp.]MCI1830391.1 SDR family oxidoreductase [Actinomyces sp.]
MTNIEYAGVPLRSRDRIEWTVTLWDEAGHPGDSVSGRFEMGLLDARDWSAAWIAGDYRPRRNTRYPVDYFRRAFATSGAVARARLYVTACGLYEAWINGHRVGEFRLTPGSTDYRYRLQYQTYDVLDLLEQDNVLEFRLADGWYRGTIGPFGVNNVFGRQTKIRAQLEVTYQDGRTDVLGTDRSFSWSNDGPLRFADLKDGEVYDARLVPSFAGQATVVREDLAPTASNNVAVRQHEAFTPTLVVTPSGQRVLDFGQNLAGFLAFTVHARSGQVIRLRAGETLDEHGEFTQANFQLQRPVSDIGPVASFRLISQQGDKMKAPMRPTPLQEVVYTCRDGVNQYKTEFAVFGFRYALVETDVEFDPGDFTAIAVYSAMEETGEFSCSNPDVNRFLENTRWSMKGNFLDVPTDCPTRERLGWTGDAQAFFDTAAYLMDVPAFMRKWLHDVRDGVLKSGKPAAVAPYNGTALMYNATGGSVGWGDAVVLVPYRLWKRYGDERILREFYDLMRGYAMFMIRHTGHRDRRAARSNPLNRFVYEKGVHLGEWLEPEQFRDPLPNSARGSVAHTEVATAYLHYTMKHLAEIAQVIGKHDDVALFTEYADGAKRAYNALFVSGGTIDTDRQAKLVRPLALGLLDGETKRTVQERLVQAVENYGYRVGTGFLSTPFLLPALTEAGRADVAYRVLQNDRAPSWLAEVRAGATTVWEDWEGEASHNHYAPGAVCQWLFDTVAGIRVAGENRFFIAPVPGGGLTDAHAEYRSTYTARCAATGPNTHPGSRLSSTSRPTPPPRSDCRTAYATRSLPASTPTRRLHDPPRSSSTTRPSPPPTRYSDRPLSEGTIRMTLTAHSSIGDWLDDPAGGPLIRGLLAQSGASEDSLAPVRALPLQQLVALSGGALPQKVLDDLVAQVNDGAAPAPEESGAWVEPTHTGRFAGKTVVVTGAASGIGQATAARVAREGGRVIAVDMSEEKLRELEASTLSAKIVAVTGDIMSQDTIDAILAATDGRIDALANVAGINDDFSPLHETSDAMWDRVIGVNLTGMFKLTRGVLPVMIAAGRGAIVNVASEAGLRGNASGNAYTVSKHGVIGLTKSAAFMYGPQGIRVNAVAPGSVATGIPFPPTVSEAGSARLRPFQAQIPTLATAEQLAASITFLLSDDGVNINGAILASDGGWSVQ